MREILREPVTPACLLVIVPNDARKKLHKMITKQEKYTESWKRSVTNNNTSSFSWHDLKENLHIPLLKMTDNHCSFCDRKFDDDEIENSIEIEHFKPKVKFPESAYLWNNLFIICHVCNKIKGDFYNDIMLKPDNNYKFDNHYRCIYKTGELELLEANNETAKITISKDAYHLNRTGLCISRKKERILYEKFIDANFEIDINDFSYRDYLERIKI